MPRSSFYAWQKHLRSNISVDQLVDGVSEMMCCLGFTVPPPIEPTQGEAVDNNTQQPQAVNPSGNAENGTAA